MPKYADKVPDIDPALTPQLETYEEQLAALVDRARRGEITRAEFQQQARQLAEAFILLAFVLAGGSLAIGGAQQEIDALTTAHRRSVQRLTDDIYSGTYSTTTEQTQEEADSKLGNRLLLWLFGLAAAWSIGQVYSTNRKARYKWRLGATERHCSDCLRLDGQVHTAAQWQQSGWRPRIRRLECGGWRCDCGLEETDEAISGRF